MLDTFETLACHGTSPLSRAIEFLTGERSHVRRRFLRDYTGLNHFGEPVTIKAGQCVEAWDEGVRCVTPDGSPVLWDTGYAKGTVIEAFSFREELTEDEFRLMARFLCSQIGKPYDHPGCDRLALPPGARHAPACAGLSVWCYDAYFCSALEAAAWEAINKPLFNGRKPYDITPQMVPESLRFNANPKVMVVS